MNMESERAIRAQLGSGEKLLWSGQPRQGLRLRSADALMIPFSLLWGGFAAFWELSVIKNGGPLFFMLWGVPFVLMGLYITVGRFFADAYRRRRTAYGLTSERAVIVSGLFTQEVQSITLRTLGDIALTERSDRSGTITLGPAGRTPAWMAGSGWPGGGKSGPPTFEMIENARVVYDQLRGAQAKSLQIGA